MYNRPRTCSLWSSQGGLFEGPSNITAVCEHERLWERGDPQLGDLDCGRGARVRHSLGPFSQSVSTDKATVVDKCHALPSPITYTSLMAR